MKQELKKLTPYRGILWVNEKLGKKLETEYA